MNDLRHGITMKVAACREIHRYIFGITLLLLAGSPVEAQPSPSVTAYLEPGESADQVISGRVAVVRRNVGYQRRVATALCFLDTTGKLTKKHIIVPSRATYAEVETAHSPKHVAVVTTGLKIDGKREVDPRTRRLEIFDLEGKQVLKLQGIQGVVIVIDDFRKRAVVVYPSYAKYWVYGFDRKLVKTGSFSKWVEPQGPDEVGTQLASDDTVTSADGRFFAVSRTAHLGSRAFCELTLLDVTGSVLFQKRIPGIYGGVRAIWPVERKIALRAGNAWSDPKIAVHYLLFTFSGTQVGVLTEDQYRAQRAVKGGL